MKFYQKLSLLLLALVITVCASCNKASSPAPSNAQNVSANAVSSQIAVNVAKSFSGTYGGVNINKGVDSLSLNGYHRAQNYNNAALCGFFSDSLVNYNSSIGDTVKSHTGGNLKFYFDCTNGISTGYTAYDSLTTAGKAPQYTFLYTVKQYYDIKSLNCTNTLLFVNGNLLSYVGLTFDNTSIKPNISNFYYVLSNLTIDLTKGGDILNGSATFTSNGSNNYGNWTYTGTIKFLGNHLADITINGKIYHANLTTGQITS